MKELGLYMGKCGKHNVKLKKLQNDVCSLGAFIKVQKHTKQYNILFITHSHMVKVWKHDSKDSHQIQDAGCPWGGVRKLSMKIESFNCSVVFVGFFPF